MRRSTASPADILIYSPASVAGCPWMFRGERNLQLSCKALLPGFTGKLHPHNIRHTFNNRLLEKARELG